MDLIVNQVVQLEVVHVTNGYRAVELLAGATVGKLRLAVGGEGQLCEVKTCGVETQQLRLLAVAVSLAHVEYAVGFLCHLAVVDGSCSVVQLADILLVRTVEYRCCDLPAERLGYVAEVYLEHLSDVHSGRYAQRVQHDVKRSTVRQERHILLTENSGNDTLVAVTTRHLIADRDLSLLCDVNADLLVNSG